MDPAPLCKTAILGFIVDEALRTLWNVSSNMRKRVQMIVGEKQIVVSEYNEKALKINGWVKVRKKGKYPEGIEKIKKGVSNYKLRNEEQAERVISLNGKLRFYKLRFKPEIPLEVDYVQEITLNQDNCHYYLKCSFNKASCINFKSLSSTQIKQIINKFKQIKHLYISKCSISSLDLSSSRIKEISFYNVTFSEKVVLPSNLDYLRVDKCSNEHFLNSKRVKEIRYRENDSLNLIKKCKGLKKVNIYAPLSELINYLRPTIRELYFYAIIDAENIDLANLKKKFPFLITIYSGTPIEMAQTLNLRETDPIITETEEIFTYRPRKIHVYNNNVEQLNKHPELFEKVEKIWIRSNKLNFDCLPDRVKEIKFYSFPIEGEEFGNLKKNSWKLEKGNVEILHFEEDEIRKILNCLMKVRKIKMDKDFEHLIKDFPQFKFILD